MSTAELKQHYKEKKIEALYFIAILPPSPLYEEVFKLKQYFKENFQSKAALNSPPHITLHMPFQWKQEKESMLTEGLEKFGKQCVSGEIQLDGFDAFPPRVIFVKVLQNQWLENLQKELQRFCKKEFYLFNANYKEHPFHPHVTVAFRDLRKQHFMKAWEEFREKKLQASFPVIELVLLKHDGKAWHAHAHFKLG